MRSHLFVLELNDLAHEFENFFYAFSLIQKYMQFEFFINLLLAVSN